MDDIESPFRNRELSQGMIGGKIKQLRPGNAGHFVPTNLRKIELFGSAGEEVNLVATCSALGYFIHGASAAIASITVDHGVGNSETAHGKSKGDEIRPRR